MISSTGELLNGIQEIRGSTPLGSTSDRHLALALRHNSAAMFVETLRQLMELPIMRPTLPALRIAGAVAFAAAGFLVLASPSARADWHGRGGWNGGGWHGGGWNGGGWRGGGGCCWRGGVFIGVAPPVYIPPPVYYAPPPVYYPRPYYYAAPYGYAYPGY